VEKEAQVQFYADTERLCVFFYFFHSKTSFVFYKKGRKIEKSLVSGKKQKDYSTPDEYVLSEVNIKVCRSFDAQ
jgi:hypothetical protein